MTDKDENVMETFLAEVNDDSKRLEWLDFMFENEPIANYIRSYCDKYGKSNQRMFQLIALAFMKQKTDRLTEEWLGSKKPKILLLKT